MRGGRLIGEAGAVEAGKEEVAGTVAGENATGAVPAMGGGGQADDQQPGLGVAETREGPAPVILVLIGTAFFAGHLFPPGHQARTAPASGYGFVDKGQGGA